MLSNYARTAIRQLAAHRLTTLINVLGLAIGLCCFLCSMLYVRYELSYDSGFTNAANIYRMSIDSTLPNGRRIDIASNAWPVAELLPEEFAQIVAATRLDDRRVLLSTDALALYQDGFRMADANFFSIFDLPWRAGDPATALESPDAIVLTESLAQAYFGDANPLGRRMLVDKAYDLVVTGVVADIPVNSHLTGTAFASTALLQRLFDPPADYLDNWNYTGLHTYFVLAPGADIAQVEAGLAAFEAKHLQTYAGLTNHMRITPLKDIYREPAPYSSLKPSLNLNLLIVLGSVALAVLLVACVNFVNLSLARALIRGREVGVRKSIGADRRQLVMQFVGEAVLMTALAMLFALLLCELSLPALSQFADRPLVLDLDSEIGNVLILVLLVGVCTGLYPAWRLSSLSAVHAPRGFAAIGGKPGVLKHALVVFQFSIAIMLLVATAVILLQLRHLGAVDMGFDRKGLVVMQGSASEGLGTRFDTLKRELLQSPAIAAVTASEQTPFRENMFSFSTRSPEQAEAIEMAHLGVSYDFLATYGIAVLAGRDFSPDFPADMAVLDERLGAETSANFVINAAAAAAYGWTPEQAVGKRFEAFIEGSYMYRGAIIGVAADSRFEASGAAIRPMVYMLMPGTLHWHYPTLDKVTVKVRDGDLAGALRHIDATWARVYPDAPLLRGFVDDDFQRVYVGETRLSDALGVLAVVTLFIACLGLYSLAAFDAQRRVKEIGVRKVMGGSVWSIVILLTSDFSKLVLLSNLIAWPVAYFAMQRWLENFAYRIDLTPLVFIGSGLIALCITWVTVGGTAAKAAAQKPVLALRYE